MTTIQEDEDDADAGRLEATVRTIGTLRATVPEDGPITSAQIACLLVIERLKQSI